MGLYGGNSSATFNEAGLLRGLSVITMSYVYYNLFLKLRLKPDVSFYRSMTL